MAVYYVLGTVFNPKVAKMNKIGKLYGLTKFTIL